MRYCTYRTRQQDTKILDHALSIEEIVGTYHEVPTECSEPGQIMRSVHYIAYVDDFMETFDLDTENLQRKQTYSSLGCH